MAFDEVTAQAMRDVARLEAEVQRLQAIVDAPRGTDAQILKERELTASAIRGAIAFGAQGINPPPSDDHWLAPFWRLGRTWGVAPSEPPPSREHRELMLLAAHDLESWMKSYHSDGATENTVKRLRDAALGVGGNDGR